MHSSALSELEARQHCVPDAIHADGQIIQRRGRVAVRMSLVSHATIELDALEL